MDILKQQHGTQTIHCLQGEVTIYDAAPLQAALLSALNESAPLTLDLSGVDELDTAGVQILVALKRSAQACGKALVFLSPSPAVTAIADLCQLHSELDLHTE